MIFHDIRQKCNDQFIFTFGSEAPHKATICRRFKDCSSLTFVLFEGRSTSADVPENIDAVR